MALQVDKVVLEQIARLYKTPIQDLKPEGGFDNLFYSYTFDGKEFFIRIKSNINLDKRSYSQIRAEVNWINFLAENGISVSKPQKSQHNNYVETLASNNGLYQVVSFEKAPGRYIMFSNHDEWNSDLWEKMGELVGKMHKLSTMYEPENNYRRKHFEDDVFFTTEDVLDKEKDNDIIDKYANMKRWISSLPKSHTAYGLVHSDLNWGNYYIYDKELTIFDFDSCCYNWFIYDIAILVYSLIWEKSKVKAQEFLKKFIPTFYKGYTKNYQLSREWISLMSEFLYFHDFFLYTAISETIMAGNETEDYPSMNKIIKQRCESGISTSYFTKKEWIELFKENLV